MLSSSYIIIRRAASIFVRFNRRMEEGEEVEQECMSMPSSSSSSSSINDVILAPINHILTSPVERGLDNIEGDASIFVRFNRRMEDGGGGGGGGAGMHVNAIIIIIIIIIVY